MKVNDALNILGLTGSVSPETIKLAYRRQALRYHPDRNAAGLEMMKLINQAFDTLKDLAGDAITNTDDTPSGTQYAEAVNTALNAVIHCHGIAIEVCGNWIWISGNTREHKETLKAAGFRWAKKKVKWYFRPDNWKSGNRYGEWAMDRIRTQYGSSEVASRTRPEIGANLSGEHAQ